MASVALDRSTSEAPLAGLGPVGWAQGDRGSGFSCCCMDGKDSENTDKQTWTLRRRPSPPSEVRGQHIHTASLVSRGGSKVWVKGFLKETHWLGVVSPTVVRHGHGPAAPYFCFLLGPGT